MTSTLPPIVQAFSGAVGSAAANVGSYPFDLVSTRLQTTQHHRKRFRAVVHELGAIIHSRGVLGLYNGLQSDTAATVVSNFIYYYAYALLRFIVARKYKVNPKTKAVILPAWQELTIGFLAGVTSRAVSTPLSVVTSHLQVERHEAKNKLQASDSKANGTCSPSNPSDEDANDVDDTPPTPQDVVRQLYAEKGLAGFWSGFPVTALLCINPAMTLLLYQTFRRIFLRGANRAVPTASQAFFGAAFSNAAAVSVLYPLIYAKSNLQTSRGTSLFSVWRDAIRREGVAGVYQGLEAQLLKGFLSQGLTMMVKQRIEALIIAIYLYRYRVSRAKA